MRTCLAVLLLLAGCATGQSHWERSGATEQEMNRELYQCTQEAMNADRLARSALINRCMRAKGWQ